MREYWQITYYDNSFVGRVKYMNGSSWPSEEAAKKELDLILKGSHPKRSAYRIEKAKLMTPSKAKDKDAWKLAVIDKAIEISKSKK